MSAPDPRFDPARHEPELRRLIAAIANDDGLDERRLQELLRRHPKAGTGLYSKSDLVRTFHHQRWRFPQVDEADFLERVRMKPVRTASGVAPVTVLTRPHPCPGACIFCPSDVRMPKSYLSDEPGAQRAAQHRFDPYGQTLSRLAAYHNNGHPVDKVELIILGGTWSHYAEAYQVWFVKRCFDALNDFGPRPRERLPASPPPGFDYAAVTDSIDGGRLERTYNQVVAGLPRPDPACESATWAELARAQRRNEEAGARCVGLALETRPDRLDAGEIRRLRRLGATKIQLGYQSLSDRVLRLNRRGHDVATTRRATTLLRLAGFKIHAHWMPNLYGSSPEGDRLDFARLFADPLLRPDELKIYPCSLIESAELMAFYRDGRWQPYGHDELVALLVDCVRSTPRYCRLTRIVRDIPGTDIVAGSRVTNLRQVVDAELERRGLESADIRAREVRDLEVDDRELRLRTTSYASGAGRELFFEYVAPGDRLAGFLRLSLPQRSPALAELDRAAVIREVHVYGRLTPLAERRRGRAQHRGLGRRLVERAARAATAAGHGTLAVISAVGTRAYYRRLGFADGELYQHRPLDGATRRAPRRSSKRPGAARAPGSC